MSTYGHVDVRVTDNHNVALQEYGITKRERSKLTTSYIQSKTDMPFRIRIRPTLPFPEFEESNSSFCFPDNTDAFGRSTRLRPESKSHQTVSREPGNGLTSPVRQPPAPWHLMATLRIDGRKRYETRSIVYLDRLHENHHYNMGETIMKHRRLTDADGITRECGWLFKEVGIESVFGKLGVSGAEEEAVSAQDEEELLTAFTALSADGLEDGEEKTARGQIEVTLDRVTLGETKYGVWRRPRDVGEDKDVTVSATATVSHAAARDAGVRGAGPISTVYFCKIDDRGSHYAKFKFYYRSLDQLRRFDFPGLSSGTTTTLSNRRKNQNALAAVASAPLSIVRPKPVRYIFNDKGEVIAEEDIPKLYLTKSKSPDRDLGSDHLKWVPKNNAFPSIAVEGPSHGLLDSPPDSPSRDDDGDECETSNIKDGRLSVKLASRLSEAEQSSADEASPQLRVSAKSHGDLLRFRKMQDATADDEEADDEASDTGRTPSSMGFRDDTGNAVGDSDDGTSQDKPDEGLGEGLNKVEIGSRKRHVSGEEGIGVFSMPKKTRMEESTEGGNEEL